MKLAKENELNQQVPFTCHVKVTCYKAHSKKGVIIQKRISQDMWLFIFYLYVVISPYFMLLNMQYYF